MKSRAEYNAYMKKYMKERYYRRRKEAIAQLGGVCSVRRCNIRRNLQFDHRDPSKKSFNIGFRLAGISEKKLQVELKKCQLLCLEHHIEKTVYERGQELARGTHGTLSAVRYCGRPLCAKCRKVYNDYSREYKRNWRKVKYGTKTRPARGSQSRWGSLVA